MKKKLIRACALFSCLLLCTACTDTIFSSMFGGDNVAIEIDLNIPGESSAATRALKTRAGGENLYDNHTDENTELQRYIGDGDYYVLIFEESEDSGSDWVLYAVPDISSFSGNNGDATRTLTAVMKKPDKNKTIIVDVVTNLVENGVYNTTSEAKSTLTSMLGQSRENVYAAIGSFTCPENSEENPYGVWNLDEDNGGRYLPMWGQSYNYSATSTSLELQTYDITPSTSELDVTCGLYRSVAKIGVTVDESCQTFQLKEIYVYYPNNQGTFVSLPVENTNWTPSKEVQFTSPEVPDEASSRSIEYPLAYKWETALGAGGQYLNNIYVAEADNKNNSTNPVCIVVGGYYTGGDYKGEGLVDGTSTEDDYTLNYYRIDLNSSATTGTTLGEGAFDIIRNHSYIFNILNANSPGTSDPDPRRATAGLTVEILDYTEVPMHGINSQYTLNVNQSLFAFEGATTDVGELIISTNGEGWKLVTSWTNEDGTTGETDDWVKVTDPLGDDNHTDDGDVVTIEPSANVNTTDIRNTSFYIQCGQIMKRIDIVQDNTETGNSYLVTEAGSYDIKVNIRGNGNTRAWTNDDGSQSESIDFNMTDSIPDVYRAAIIWETAEGFVTIPNPYEISESGCLAYEVNNVSLGQFGDWTGNVFDPGNGANALIGVYDSSNNLLWSYHIWGVGDYADGDLTETWQTGSDGKAYYSYMDRNLGAYSNLPGSKSFGLLYQWGRKDPFIGAYREAGTNGTYERDFRQVRKQYTIHYEQPNGRTYVWGNYNDTSVEEAQDVEYAIANPTTILDEGLLNTSHSSTGSTAQAQAKGLWGTSSYTADVSETGNKTMYDPCPPGYRVPSLNALTIYDGHNDLWEASQAQHSSFSSRFVPVPQPTGTGSVEGDQGEDYRTGNGCAADFVSGAPFYGFWLDYANEFGFNSSATATEGEGPGGTTTTTWALDSLAYGVNYYSDTTVANGTYGWITNYVGTKPSTVTWIPMAGIYNGSMESFGRAGLTDLDPDLNGPGGQGGGGQGGPPGARRRAKASSEGYLPASSLEVTSVLWANSPTANNENYPGGLLIHGTEGAYTPHQTDGTPYWYSSGTATSTTGTPGSVATEGKGYWTTDDSGSSTTASGWWTGSVDYGKSSMDSSIQSGQWNGDNQITNYNSWDDENGFNQSGRHFHSFIESNASVYANPSYAASVRCIRDKDAIVHTNDTIFVVDGENLVAYEGEPLTLYYYGSGETQDVISLAISYIEEWEVVSPGAKWVSINPTSGTTSSSTGTIDAIEITYIESYLPEDASTTNPAEATIIIKTARGETFSINIQYVGGTRSN